MDAPLLHIDLAVVRQRYEALRLALPGAEIAYAVKANPHPEVLHYLAHLGASFDIASPTEMQAVMDCGVPPQRIEYSHPVKPSFALARAARAGVTRFSLDSEEEIGKIAQACSRARALIRLDVDHAGAAWPLGDKFGVPPHAVPGLVSAIADAGVEFAGLTFHVGSMQTDPYAYSRALETCAQVAETLSAEGATVSEINIGGGLPAYLTRREVPALEVYAQAIRDGLQCFQEPVKLTLEPGRYLIADAGTLTAALLGVTTRGGQRWAYLNAGYYHGLGETHAVPVNVNLLRDSDAELVPTILAGPTCDSVDVLFDREPQLLPADLRDGDHLEFTSVGAYCTDVSTTFNGFPPPDVLVRSSEAVSVL